MTARILNGRELADHVLADITQQVIALGAPVHCAAVCVGDDSGLRSFVKLKQKAAQSVGMTFSSYLFDATQAREARETLQFLADDESVHGIVVELPLPEGVHRDELLALIPVTKDADVISPDGEHAYYTDASPILPPAVRALELVIGEYDIPIRNASAVVVGQGQLVGKPITHWLERQGADVMAIDVATENPTQYSRDADVVVVGTGVPGLITGDWIKDGAAVIDFGFSKREGAYVGDVDAASVTPKAGLLTPVPGGVGPLVVAAMLENVLALATRP
jgi:methylenetetrahydrofolate dehydrogenase (NADP+)/methenyltetrahydrofolate cyclohydrolase